MLVYMTKINILRNGKLTKTFKKLREDTLDEQYFSHVGRDVNQKLSYDNWLKQVKGIEKGVHGTKGDEHTKLSKQWRDYKKEELELDEGKYTQYSSLLVQKGKLLAKGFIPQSITVTRINKEIDKEKKKLDMTVPKDHVIDKNKVLSDLKKYKDGDGDCKRYGK